MGSDDYTKRELDMCFDEINRKLDTIHEQTVKTNGRIGSLEKWRSFITGGLAVLTMLVVPVLISIVLTWVK